MRITTKQLAAEQERMRLEAAGEWFPTPWWRVVLADGSLYCETSSENEAREDIPKGATVQHLFEKHKRQWRDA
jgi:alkylated DNA nucleotide flippase Atl1